MPIGFVVTRAHFIIAAFITCAVSSLCVADEVEQTRKPTLFLIGDSTVRCGRGKGGGGMYGWGQVLEAHFDLRRITIKNRAIGGRSSRTFLTEGRWEAVRSELHTGDFVLIQFGHNDGGQMFAGDRPRASIKGNGDETEQGNVESTGENETVYSYGWYLRRFALDARERGATPVILSLIPRDIWKDGHVVRANEGYGRWAREAAEQVEATFVDLNEIVAQRYERDGRSCVHQEYFTAKDHTHTSLRGAEVNAECLVEGLRANCKALAGYLVQPKKRSQLTEEQKGTPVQASQRVSVTLPEGNYTVRVKRSGNAPLNVYAELRRLMIERSTEPTCRFSVNIRTPRIDDDNSVKLKPRELTSEAAAWDNKLTLDFEGASPESVEIVAAQHVITAYLLGDSTVADQPKAPWSSWGQILPRFLDAHVSVANHAESGESIRTALRAGRFDKVFSQIKPGDYLFVQFGHNDMKNEAPDAIDEYREQLRDVTKRALQKNSHPVLVTSMERKAGILSDTLGNYPNVVREIAAELEVPMIDLHAMSKQLYAGMGAHLDAAFVDATHHTEYGSYQLACCVVAGIREKVPGLARHLRHDFESIDVTNPGRPATSLDQ